MLHGRHRRLTGGMRGLPCFSCPATADRAIWSGSHMFGNLAFTNAGWSSSVARWAHNPEVAGSNPVPATSGNGPRRRLRGPFSSPDGNPFGNIGVGNRSPGTGGRGALVTALPRNRVFLRQRHAGLRVHYQRTGCPRVCTRWCRCAQIALVLMVATGVLDLADARAKVERAKELRAELSAAIGFMD